MKKIALAAIAAVILSALPSTSHAIGALNGLATNGLYTNGLYTNALIPNGLYTNGLYTNALIPNALHPNALHPNALHLNALHQNWRETNSLTQEQMPAGSPALDVPTVQSIELPSTSR